MNTLGLTNMGPTVSRSKLHKRTCRARCTRAPAWENKNAPPYTPCAENHYHNLFLFTLRIPNSVHRVSPKSGESSSRRPLDSCTRTHPMRPMRLTAVRGNGQHPCADGRLREADGGGEGAPRPQKRLGAIRVGTSELRAAEFVAQTKQRLGVMGRQAGSTTQKAESKQAEPFLETDATGKGAQAPGNGCNWLGGGNCCANEARRQASL